MTKEFFNRVGGFDASFPVCEDYDLWLRVAVVEPVRLLDVPLVVKRGGHADQLSRSMWGMDRFRIAAIRKLLYQGLDREKREWAVEALRRKIAIMAGGARKRGREGDAEAYEAMLSEFCEESIGYVGTIDPRIRTDQRISPADHRALA